MDGIAILTKARQARLLALKSLENTRRTVRHPVRAALFRTARRDGMRTYETRLFQTYDALRRSA